MSLNIENKVCLVTGATSGIGKETAAALASQGATIVITGRRPARIEAAVQEIRSLTANPNIHALQADFSNLEEVHTLANAFKERFPRLDVLVNNAGAYFNQRHERLGEVELTFVVNHLAPFLLTGLLLDRLLVSTPARIVNVSSGAHHYDNMDFNNLGFQRGYFGLKAYARSKLANILFTYELDRRLANNGVTVNAVHPGQVTTDIWRTNFSIFGPLVQWLISLNALTPEQGAQPVIHLASSPQAEGISGKYFNRMKMQASSAISYDETVAQRLWRESERLTGYHYPEITR